MIKAQTQLTWSRVNTGINSVTLYADSQGYQDKTRPLHSWETDPVQASCPTQAQLMLSAQRFILGFF